MQPRDELPPEERDWRRFQQLRQLGNHWERPGWAEGRRSYHWLLTFEHASGLHEMAARCQAPFRELPEFDTVPLDSLHLTLRRIAFKDELPRSALSAVAGAVRQRCQSLGSFRLRVGWLAGSTGAIRFTALPLQPVLDLRAMIVKPNTMVSAPEPIAACAPERFWPHLSIAYSNTAQPAAPIAAMIEDLRSLPPAEVQITSLALVELRREDRAYKWEELERIGIDNKK